MACFRYYRSRKAASSRWVRSNMAKRHRFLIFLNHLMALYRQGANEPVKSVSCWSLSSKQIFSRKNFSDGAAASIGADRLWNPFGVKVVMAAQSVEIDTASSRKLGD